MPIVIYYLFAVMFAAAVFATGFFIRKKNPKYFGAFAKICSLVLALFFVLRYMWDKDVVSTVFALENGAFESKIQNLFSIILVWLTYSSNILLTLFGFFKIKRIDKYVAFLSLPITILNILFFGFHFSAIMGSGAINSFSVRGFWFAIEIGVAFGYAVLIAVTQIDWKHFFKKEKGIQNSNVEIDDEEIVKQYNENRYKQKLERSSKRKRAFVKIEHAFAVCFGAVKRFFSKHWFEIFAVIVLVLSTMPSYTLQAIFGEIHQSYKVKDLEIPHRIIIYIGIFLPFLIHFSLKKQEYNEKKFYLLFITLGTLLTYSLTKKFDAFLDPTSWPLHLCNTAMYIMPLVLIFNMKRFFYFTYFINVIGAFFAMMMPNYSASLNMFSSQVVNFYVNHYIAFFMPILYVSLGMFERPKFKQFVYSMTGFAAYFVFVIFINSLYTGLFEIGKVSQTTDFFFVNSDFIADKLGNWAERLRDVKIAPKIGEVTFTLYPVYQVLFFLTYVALGFAMWFVYEQGFMIAERFEDQRVRRQKIRVDELAVLSKMNGRSLTEPMNPENANKLILRNFSKRYGNSEVFAVDGANLEVNGGEIFGFLGPNGAGKSTIIKTIVGIQPITSGEIEVCGYDINSQSVESKRCIGFVPDHYALYEKLTGREYINYIADLYKVPLVERNQRIDNYVKRFELEQAFDNQIKTYSHGMKQKITIMAALVHDPKVWILDEPLTGLDPNSIYQVKECMKERAKEGNIVFFSSHIIDVVERICDRIAIIKKGKILLTKSVKEIEDSGVSLEDFYMRTINGDDYQKELNMIDENKE